MRSGRIPPRTVLITGASRGLGAALARLYASDGLLLGLAARSETERLAAVARDCESTGAEVVTACFDVTDAVATRAWVGRVGDVAVFIRKGPSRLSDVYSLSLKSRMM